MKQETEVKLRNGSSCILYDKQFRFLLQKKPSDYIPAPNAWVLFGGGIERTETPRQTMIRELEEEIGLEIDPYEWETKEYELQTQKGSDNIFFAYLHQNLNTIRLNEGIGFSLFEFKELEKLLMVKHQYESIFKFRAECF